ncbi:hypothetical protein AB8P72_03495 [Psychrobacter sp. CLB018]|uniref:hypothetical protein n=1 Tax=Psychrobacter sp. CLB018 TaxID=3240930 RepID=UPI0035190A01
MHIVYLCNFDLTKSSGKDRATKQKLEALADIVPSLTVFSLYKGGSLYKLLKGFSLDIKCASYILANKPDILISRGNTGFFSVLIAKLMGVLTVREIHALSKEEIKLLGHKSLKLFLLKSVFNFFHSLDLWVDIRIFNHPFLLNFYKEKGWSKLSDFYCYNGYGNDSLSLINKSEARHKFSFNDEYTYLVFTGSVSVWHGVEYLVDLQKEFNKYGDKIKIVVGGGSLKQYDPDSVCINISPLDDIGCNELIKAADACLLPVKNNRVSPGSPLKLYDYINNNKPVIAENIIGYSDEVLKYDCGIGVSFEKTEKTRKDILHYLNNLENNGFRNTIIEVSWKNRMDSWLSKLKERV